jgi:hypothetical protein
MGTDFQIEIAGKTFTPENAHEIAEIPNVDTGTESSDVVNVAGDVRGLCIQARDIRGPLSLG